MPTPEHQADPTAVSRKKDHIELAFASQVAAAELDSRFYYEPLLAAHPDPDAGWPLHFLGKPLGAPLWVSSMTGGTEKAGRINRNLARACSEFRLGMGLGSCRQLLYSSEHLPDFDVRDTLGPDLPLYANLGVAQLETLLANKAADKIDALIHLLRADGLIVHVNPLQEAMQPEGDRYLRPALETIQAVLENTRKPVIVKEVGQGMGPESLRALLQMPLAAVEFAAAGGTNFAKLELHRADALFQDIFGKMALTGHSAAEMLHFVSTLKAELGAKCQVPQLIISGGIRHFLDGYYLLEKSPLPAVFGQASGFLKYAEGNYETLQAFVQAQIRGLNLAKAFLRVK
jgi:isopentenyl-diphosphate Delta-isomerase